MAIYQFKIVLIPRLWAKQHAYNPSSLVDDEVYDTSSTWKNYELKYNLNELISKILPSSETWSQTQNAWGHYDYDHIEAFWDNDTLRIESFSVRFDLRKNINKFLEGILELVNMLECDIYIPENKKIIIANIMSVTNEITNSRAFRFVSDPNKFLVEI